MDYVSVSLPILWLKLRSSVDEDRLSVSVSLIYINRCKIGFVLRKMKILTCKPFFLTKNIASMRIMCNFAVINLCFT